MHHAVRVGLGLTALAAATGTLAQSANQNQTTNLQGVAVSAAVDDPNLAPPGTAAALAPSQGSLFEVEPQSVLSRGYIKTIATPKADYLALLELTPSAVNASPNGAGLSSKSATVRGFQDGEYDVTFDGIPFGDPGAFGHATTAFFPGPSLGKVVVDRGPGTASNVGNATFGGTVALYSAPTTDKPSGEVSTMYGSGATWQVAGEGNTGTMNKIGTQASVNYSHLESDGLIDNAGFRQDNALFKVKQPLGDRTTLTLVADYNKVKWNTFTAQPKKRTDRFGLEFGGLNRDPESQGFFDYNIDDRHADFEYLQLHGDYNGWRFDDKFYTYGLRDSGPGGVDLLGNTPNKALLPAGGVPGAINHSRYRAVGNMLAGEKDVGSGWLDSTLRAGIWAERTYQVQDQVTVDLSTMTPRVLAGTPNADIIDTNQHTSTTQSYLEVEWRPLENLSIVPGVKQIVFDRTLDGVSNFLPVGGAGHFATTLATLAANYRIAPGLAVYGQYAEGYQAPKVNILQGNGGHVDPQQTKNYQAGIVWKTPTTVADLDVYYIDFANLVTSIEEPIGPGGSLVSVFANQGGVIYKGVEGEYTHILGESGFSFTANGSVNTAYSKTTHRQISNAPESTADVGFIYDRGPLYGSFLVKYVGTRFTGVGETGAENYNPNTKLPTYNYANFNIGYRFTPDLRLQLSTNNLFDHRAPIQGNGAASNPTYYYLAARNYTAQLTYTF
ncbi:TonB-dependent receptor [Luteibacter yeojuensis]|uniref:TonB-dependent receptor n=1 Tax=Luteibacter yeojuensis TaxID=345309 RepID=A0A7X5QT53_9GAMM|nr:TonB-dependent receptor [Luteibacter yeojuensis]NID14835.1 TonB-dependent receptor [Luteibacter yeojuensis]